MALCLFVVPVQGMGVSPIKLNEKKIHLAVLFYIWLTADLKIKLSLITIYCKLNSNEHYRNIKSLIVLFRFL